MAFTICCAPFLKFSCFQVSQASVAHLFSEMVCYAVRRQGPDNEHLESKLHKMGASMGPGLLELTYMRDTSRNVRIG